MSTEHVTMEQDPQAVGMKRRSELMLLHCGTLGAVGKGFGRSEWKQAVQRVVSKVRTLKKDGGMHNEGKWIKGPSWNHECARQWVDRTSTLASVLEQGLQFCLVSIGRLTCFKGNGHMMRHGDWEASTRKNSNSCFSPETRVVALSSWECHMNGLYMRILHRGFNQDLKDQLDRNATSCFRSNNKSSVIYLVRRLTLLGMDQNIYTM